MKRKPIKELYACCIDYASIDKDWSDGYAEDWESTEAIYCDTCNKLCITNGGEQQHCDIDTDSKCTGYIYSDGPMMNYYYPLPEDFYSDWYLEEAAMVIGNTNLCIVHLLDTDEYALALTGGGMDLPWDICEAYMLLGYLPPTHFCDLPDFAGTKLNAKNKWIISGCQKSCKISMELAKYTLNKLSEYKKRLKNNK